MLKVAGEGDFLLGVEGVVAGREELFLECSEPIKF